MWKRSKVSARDEEILLFLIEEIGELAQALRKARRNDRNNSIDLEKEFGDVVFNLVSLAIRFDINLSVSVSKALEDIDQRYCK